MPLIHKEAPNGFQQRRVTLASPNIYTGYIWDAQRAEGKGYGYASYSVSCLS